ncbi:unnamed protein product [Microthlaspi erraticum]|uniref:Uncharacterized protein n=1 Tax=Microthlaspi erraticum TaxID=1685480 RepID=A0A6D2ILZ4_9BRAS|nr:unnamed protein product [Microthlaspi erraticum]
MDFIKTSSLRALIELTFQRNWNGLIWMSRKGVITKRVKTVQTALSRISAQPRSPAGRETMFPRSAKVTSVRLKSRPKFKPTGRSRNTTRETLSRGRPSQTLTPHRARPKRASRETRPRGRATRSRTTADASVRAGKNVPRPAENFIGQISSARPRRPTANPSDPDRSDSPTTRFRPIVPHDRPNAAVDPKPFLKPKLMFSSPA